MKLATVQERFDITPEQKAALLDACRKLGVSQGQFLRSLIANATLTPDPIQGQKFSELKQRQPESWKRKGLRSPPTRKRERAPARND